MKTLMIVCARKYLTLVTLVIATSGDSTRTVAAIKAHYDNVYKTCVFSCSTGDFACSRN